MYVHICVYTYIGIGTLSGPSGKRMAQGLRGLVHWAGSSGSQHRSGALECRHGASSVGPLIGRYEPWGTVAARRLEYERTASPNQRRKGRLT